MANQQDYLQHDGFVNNETDLPQYDYSSTQDPSSGTVFSHYDLPQTATTGFANQPYHIVTQDQPNYFVADPTMASSVRMASQEDYLQHDGCVNNVTDLPQHHYSNAQPSSGTVLSHYDPPQTDTTGFANQPHHFVTQDQLRMRMLFQISIFYGSMEARDIWNNNGGQNLGKGEDLYFFTKLKPTSNKVTGSRVARTIGSGTWHGQNSGTKVKDPKTKETKQQENYNVTDFPQCYYDSQEPMARPDDCIAEAACPTLASSLGMAN
ncbi:hypothetical protein TB2_007052 [Malus domestica]|uniref:NAC domain-containing protein n=1 Tax=Malus domestica TaxID=3750 RepID=A0A498IH44_MALDO|nr:hypothetical protein DVH24_003204 [Malus domestica]